MNRFITAILVGAALVLPSGVLYADPLAATSPEYSQLVAMGYDIQTSEPTDKFTIVTSETGKMILSKTENLLTVARLFIRSRTNLTKEEQLELLEIVNQINIDLSYQMSLSNDYITVASYYTGPYNPKVFANLVHLMAMADSIFDKYPAIFKLINK